MLLHAFIKGRVQGVGFRYWVHTQAKKLGVTGWVRNLKDGRVEVEAAGTDDQLFELEQLLWKGPTLSRVDDVKVTRTESDRTFPDFSITH
jgi:acylphosphatase